MKSIADDLPAELAAFVHPEWRTNEAEYWAARDGVRTEYEGRWVAFAGGEVIASDADPVEVLKAAQASGRHPFVIRVGAECEPCRMRRAAFAYDSTSSPVPLPVVEAEFRAASGTSGIHLDRVIPDTGADASALPWPDCGLIGLNPATGVPARVGGAGGTVASTLTFLAWVWLDGQEYPCRIQADLFGPERILGRDVLNRLEILFRGPAGEVVINP